MVSKKSRSLIVGVLILGSFITALAQTVLTSAMPSIMHDFSITADTAQWLTTVYMLVLGVMIPATAYLISNFSTKKLYITSMLLFFTGCLISLFTQSFSLLIVSRICQAMGSGIIMQLVQVSMINLYPVEERGSAMVPGLMMLPGAILMSLLNPISGRILDKYGARVLSLSGFLCLVVGTFAFSNLTKTTSITALTVMYSFRMVWIALLMMPVTTWGLNSLDQGQIADSSAIGSTLRQVAGAIGSSIFIAIMTHVTNSSVSSNVQASIDGMNATFRSSDFLVVVGFVIAFIYVRDNRKKVE